MAKVLSGPLTVRGYHVLGVPEDGFRDVFERAINAHKALAIDPDGIEEKSVGWCALDDDTKPPTSWLYEDSIVLSIRFEALKIPADTLRRAVDARVKEREAEQGPLSKSQREEIKDLIKRELRKKAFPKISTAGMVWFFKTQELFFFSSSTPQNEAFLQLFGQTFALGVDLSGPTRWSMIAEDRLKGLRAAPELIGGFRGVRSDVLDATPESSEEVAEKDVLVDRRFLGREFLTWLLYTCDAEARGETAGSFKQKDGGSFRIHLGDRVLLRSVGVGGVEVSAKGPAICMRSDVRYSIAGGHTVRALDLAFDQNDRLWTGTIYAENFDIKSGKLPALFTETSDDPTVAVQERLELIHAMRSFLRCAFEQFLRTRVSHKRWIEEMKAIGTWLQQALAEPEPRS